MTSTPTEQPAYPPLRAALCMKGRTRESTNSTAINQPQPHLLTTRQTTFTKTDCHPHLTTNNNQPTYQSEPPTQHPLSLTKTRETPPSLPSNLQETKTPNKTKWPAAKHPKSRSTTRAPTRTSSCWSTASTTTRSGWATRACRWRTSCRRSRCLRRISMFSLSSFLGFFFGGVFGWFVVRFAGWIVGGGVMTQWVGLDQRVFMDRVLT